MGASLNRLRVSVRAQGDWGAEWVWRGEEALGGHTSSLVISGGAAPG